MRTRIYTFQSGASFAVPTLIFWNTLVFILWQFSDETPDSFMVRYFTVSYQALTEGRWITLLTSVYSHSLFLHFFVNMYVLRSFGSIIERRLGFRRFMRFYFYAGIFSSLAHSLLSKYLLNDPSQSALGASGAVAGIVVLFCLFFPKEKIAILGIIPVPALFGALLIVGIDVWGLMAQAGGHGLPIGHGAHLGGAFVGVLYFLYLKGSKSDFGQAQVYTSSKTQQGNPKVIDIDYKKL